MWKKAIPTVALCSLLLVGCNNTDDTIPSNNETPMQDLRQGVDEIMPDPGVNTPSPTNEEGMYDNTNDGFNGVNDNNGVNNGVNDNNGVYDGIEDAQPKVQDDIVPNDGNIMNGPANTKEEIIKEDVIIKK
ncbi:hypothetical protein [Psychrobacillus vulpis]|uniref:Lipoprotein n=1 Tax=Psychrobacillus vulpis TaxID=2325572 RepID=A0A544TUS9_9BACI|nr:hypothetical protein [Psychrobacillus vulpis]TQR21187.1 hypothetical protein FG384_02980 [Psychrobacillus vulpis]